MKTRDKTVLTEIWIREYVVKDSETLLTSDEGKELIKQARELYDRPCDEPVIIGNNDARDSETDTDAIKQQSGPTGTDSTCRQDEPQ